jgi:outer membrane protein OmpA-like peptidoglycan-associated protein
MNQMPTSIIVVKEWALLHEKEIVAMLKQTYTANNQIKLYDQWAVRASEAVAKTYNFETPKYWYDLFKGQKGSKDGLDYNIGGSKVFNYADAMQYFGITDGNNRYKAVYNQVSTYLTDLNPCGFNETCKEGVVDYEDAVNLYFLKSVTDVDAGKTEKVSYAETKTEVMASGEWNINFATNSTEIQGSEKDLATIYNLLSQAEQSKVTLIGHTDNTGNSEANVTLSQGRAESVRQYLINKGISEKRFQVVSGKGSSEPIATNKTAEGKAQNRRVQITIFK